MKSTIIGITGGSGSGKTSLAKDLTEYMAPNASLLALDNYYLPIEEQPKDVNGRPNFDLPHSLDLLKFKQDLLKLSSGLDIVQKEYTFNNEGKVSPTIIVKAKPFIIVEGLFIFHLTDMLQLYNVKIFIHSHEVQKLNRRMKRDVETRGYSLEDIEYCHLNHVKPSYKKFIHQQKNIADLIVYNNGDYNSAFKSILTFLENR